MTTVTPLPADPARGTPVPPPDATTTAPVRPSAPATALPALVERHAERTPDALAVVDGDTTLTYGRLLGAAAPSRRTCASTGSSAATGWRS